VGEVGAGDVVEEEGGPEKEAERSEGRR